MFKDQIDQYASLRALPPLVMSKREAAKVCGVSVRTLSDWISKHGLKAFKLEGTVRVMRRHLMDFLNSRCDVGIITPAPQMEGSN